jgi:hypothetical protein
MSHFTRIRTQIRERAHLVQALRDLHYRFQEGENLVVRGYAGSRERAEVVVDTGSQYDIGFQRKEGVYEAVADWSWGVEGHTALRQASFLQQVQQQYAYNVLRDQAREQNLIVEEDYVQENGDRVLIFSERG